MKEKYMLLALKEANKAFKHDEVPVGCVIVKNDKIISKAYNKKEKTNMVTKHAEIIAIEKACKKLKTWHLNDCELYTTLEPCLMCLGAILQSRIRKIYCSTKNNKFNDINQINKIYIEYDILKNESIHLLKKFFSKKRK